MCGLASLQADKIGWSGILGVGKNLGHLQVDSIHYSKVLEGIAFNLGVFLVILRLRRVPLGSQKCGVASLDMAEIGWWGRLSLGRNLGQPQNSFNYLIICTLEVFLLILGLRVGYWGHKNAASLNVDEIGCTRILDMGRNLKQLQNDLNHFSKALGEMPLSLGCFWSFWGYDGSPWGYGWAAWPLWMWMRLNKVADLVWLRI